MQSSEGELQGSGGSFVGRWFSNLDGGSLAFRAARILAFYAALAVLWQAIYELGIWTPSAVPSPSSVLDSLREYTGNGLLPEAVRVSMQHIAIGYGLSVLVGVAVGMACGANKYVDETAGGLVLGLQSLPSICWLPLALLWFGENDSAIIFVVFMGSFSAIAISARAGMQAIPPLYRRAAATMGASRYESLRYVLLPAMVPSMAQGLKLGWSFAWRSLMAGELLFGANNLGQLLNLGRGQSNLSLVVAIMFVIVAIGLTVDRLVFARMEGWVQERWGLAQR